MVTLSNFAPVRVPFRTLGILLGIGLLCQACRKSTAVVEDPLPAAAGAEGAPEPSAAPLDQLAKAELVEGREKGFGLVLPRDVRVRNRFPKAVHADGYVSLEAAANFFRARVTGGKVETGAYETRFEKVASKTEPGRVLNILVRTDERVGCSIVVDDVTPPPDPPGTPAERMRGAGLSPDGKLLDRNKIE
jgi:hypothetical protein